MTNIFLNFNFLFFFIHHLLYLNLIDSLIFSSFHTYNFINAYYDGYKNGAIYVSILRTAFLCLLLQKFKRVRFIRQRDVTTLNHNLAGFSKSIFTVYHFH